MEQILSITKEQFLTGIGGGMNEALRGFWYAAKGMCPYINPYPASSDFGLLQTLAAPTQIGAATITDEIIDFENYVYAADKAYMYMLGDTGKFYRLSYTGLTNSAIYAIATIPSIAAEGCSLKLFSKNSAVVGSNTDRIYIFRQTAVSEYRITPPTAITHNTLLTGLAKTYNHPSHLFGGKVYFGNLSGIGRLVNTPAVSNYALDFEQGFITTAINDDGTYLVAAITKNRGGYNIYGTKTKLIFWDTFSPSWNREYDVPDTHIGAIARVGRTLLAFGAKGVYEFGLNKPPTLLKELTSNEAIKYGCAKAIDVFLDGMVFWGGASKICSYGSLKGLPPAYFEPLQTATATIGGVNSSFKHGKLFYSTSDSKLYRVNLLTGGNPAYPTELQSYLIDLKDMYNIQQIELEFALPLASEDSIAITLITDSNQLDTTWGTISYTNNGAVKKASLFGVLQTNQVQISLTISNTGNPKIKKITLYGTRTKTI